MKRKNSRLSKDDLTVFHEAMNDVRPIKSDKVLISEPPRRGKISSNNDIDPLSSRDYLDVPEQEREVGQHESLFFHRGGLQLKLLQRLKRGTLDTEAELDLHGFNRQTASQAMLQFLDECIEVGFSRIRIIHGKGSRSMNDNPVLKTLVANTLPQHRYVLAFASAPRHQGGAGAVNVILKRKKQF